MVKNLSGSLSNLKSIKALVLGDLMLDKYTTGEVARISPEAPVKILHVKSRTSRPGGAGNVAINLVALNAKVTVLGRLGFDEDGQELVQNLKNKGMDTSFLIRQRDYPTTSKDRLIASSQQLLRIDSEKLLSLPYHLELRVFNHLKEIIPKMQVIAISDYGKGFLTDRILKKAIELARAFKVPVIVDPKGLDFTKYQYATILKPNQKEAYAAAKQAFAAPLNDVAKQILKESHVEKLLITRSEAGMTLFNRRLERLDFPVRSKEVVDVTGAGDTVLATLAVAVANNFQLTEAINLANIAAGIAVEHVGCAEVTLVDLAERLLELDTKSKIFDESHLYALEQVLKNKQYTLLGVESTKGMSTDLFRQLYKLSQEKAKLIVYLKDEKPKEEFVRFLSGLPLIDFIVVQKKSLAALKRKVKPLAVLEM